VEELMYEYECALTGLAAEATIETDNSDELGDLPVGWTRIRMTRRQYNPKFLLLQQVKQATIEGLLLQVPEELREYQQYAISLQVEAMYHGVENDTPMFLPDVDDIIFVSDEGEVVSELNEIRSALGLEAMPEDEEVEEEDGPEEETTEPEKLPSPEKTEAEATA
jgi:hypothetical protein